jgi:hypothetical protein
MSETYNFRLLKKAFQPLEDAFQVFVMAISVWEMAYKAFKLAPRYRHARFGFISRFLNTLGLFDIPGIQVTHWNINCRKDTEIMDWKKAYTDGCNAVAIAVRPLINR